MIFSYFFADYYRKKHLKRLTHSSSIKDYLNHPLVKSNKLIKDLEFLVLDFETTGLDADNDRIISLGYTVIKNLHLLPKTSTHVLINPKQQLTEDNVGIHKLTDEELQNGVSLNCAMEGLLSEMAGRVIVVHFDVIEKSFINRACLLLYQMKSLPMVMIDTLKIEQKKSQHIGPYVKQQSMRLYALREKYNLPRYRAHNAMQDAIATAELFLAQIDYIGRKHLIKLKDLI